MMQGLPLRRCVLVVSCVRTRSSCVVRCLLWLLVLTIIVPIYITFSRHAIPQASNDPGHNDVSRGQAVQPVQPQTALGQNSWSIPVSSTFPGHDEESAPRPQPLSDDDVATRFQHRRRILQSACQRFGNSSAFKNITMEDVPILLYKPVVNLSIGYCAIQKASSTTWKFIFNSIRRKMTGLGIPGTPVNASFGQRDVVFAFVREPYARLLSAYVDKLFSPNAMFWRKTGRYIVENFRQNASWHSRQCGHDVTFPEFVQYFIHSQRTRLHRDGHFVPVHDHCQFCDFPYQYIGHLETIKEDLPFLLKTIQSPLPYNISQEYYSEGTISFNTHRALTLDRSDTQRCMGFDEASRRLWKTFQMRGLISKNQRFPLTRKQTQNITEQELIRAEVQGLLQAGGKRVRSLQSREALREAFANIPLQDRKEVQKLLFLDFEMFGYDPEPEDVFPLTPPSPDPFFSYFDLYK